MIYRGKAATPATTLIINKLTRYTVRYKFWKPVTLLIIKDLTRYINVKEAAATFKGDCGCLRCNS